MLRVLGIASLWLTAAVAQTNFPPPPAPAWNPPTLHKQLLGMALFFEEQLSSTSTVACASCHDFTHGGGDPRARANFNSGADGLHGTADDQHGSPGVSVILGNDTMLPVPFFGFGPRVTGRRAPTVINSAYHTHLAYDGSSTTLEQLVGKPILNLVEMSRWGRTWADVGQQLTTATPLLLASNLPARLQNFVAGRTYPQLFSLAFGTASIDQQAITQALASYVRTLNSDQSKWDLHLHGQAQLTAQEQLGLQLFNSAANGATACNVCHSDFDSRVLLEGPMVGQMTMTTFGPYGAPVPTRLMFHNIGVRPNSEDNGRQAVTFAAGDVGKFRVASLRNVEHTAPYFHNGGAKTLQEVLDFYDRGGDFHANQAANLTPRNYTIAEKAAIIALLKTLTDPRLAAGAAPFDQPTLGSQNGRLVTSIGASAVTSQGPLVAYAPFAPRLGEAGFRLTLLGAAPGDQAILMWDVAPATGAMPFNLQLAVTPAFSLSSMGSMQAVFTVPSGMLQVPMPLPATPALSGQTFYVQWLVPVPSNHGPVSLSNGLRIPLL
ncbi:MAG: cytochrome c peroxidase [Planctomycetota bacterium]